MSGSSAAATTRRGQRLGREGRRPSPHAHPSTPPVANTEDSGGWSLSSPFSNHLGSPGPAPGHSIAPQSGSSDSGPLKSALSPARRAEESAVGSERLLYAPDLPSEFPCYPKGGFRQSMGIDMTDTQAPASNDSSTGAPPSTAAAARSGANASENAGATSADAPASRGSSASVASLNVDFECIGAKDSPRRSVLEQGEALAVCCYEAGKQRPPDEGCSQGMLACTAHGFGGSAKPRVQCSASAAGRSVGARTFPFIAPHKCLETNDWTICK